MVVIPRGVQGRKIVWLKINEPYSSCLPACGLPSAATLW